MFDLEDHRKRQEIIVNARKKWPAERNVTNLYRLGCEELGIQAEALDSRKADHLPTIEESAKANPLSRWTFLCTGCGRMTYILRSLCGGCLDSENGKFKSMFKCRECGYIKKSEKGIIYWMDELKIPYGNQSKKSLGIETQTDEGLR